MTTFDSKKTFKVSILKIFRIITLLMNIVSLKIYLFIQHCYLFSYGAYTIYFSPCNILAPGCIGFEKCKKKYFYVSHCNAYQVPFDCIPDGCL